jgi:hypothetical protein
MLSATSLPHPCLLKKWGWNEKEPIELFKHQVKDPCSIIVVGAQQVGKNNS